MRDEAIEYFRRSIELKRQLKNEKGALRSLGNTGYCYLFAKEIDSALHCYREVYSESERTKFPGGKAIGANGIGRIFAAQGNYDSALVYFGEADRIFRRIGDKHGWIENMICSGDAFADKKNTAHACSIFQTAYDSALSVSDWRMISDICGRLTGYFRNSGDYQKALKYYTLRNAYRDSLPGENLAKEAVKVQLRQQQKIYAQEMEQLRNQEMIQTLQVSKKNSVIIFLAVGLTAIVTIIIMLARWQYRLSQSRKLLQEKNQAIEKQKTELEAVMYKLKDSLANAKTLSGLLPICANCNKIRDDKGYWRQVELYVSERSDAKFSYGVCPDCEKRDRQ